MICRRKLLTGLASALAAPAIIGRAEAQAIFAPFMAHGTGGGGGGPVTGASRPQTYFFGKAKPLGDIEINWQHPLAPLVSMVDRGDGIYIDYNKNYAVNNFGQVSRATGNYGNGSKIYGITSDVTPWGPVGTWPGNLIQSDCGGDGCTGAPGSSGQGLGADIQVGADTGSNATTGAKINAIFNLASLGAGAGWSMATQFVRKTGVVTADFELIAARTWISVGEGWQSSTGPGILAGFAENFNNSPPGAGNYVCGGYVTSGTVPSPVQQTVFSTTVTPGLYYNFGLDAVNVASGNATVRGVINGVVLGSPLTGLSLPTTLNSGETNVYVGACYHDSGLSNHTPYTDIFKVDVWPFNFSTHQWAYYYDNPWCFFQPKGA